MLLKVGIALRMIDRVYTDKVSLGPFGLCLATLFGENRRGGYLRIKCTYLNGSIQAINHCKNFGNCRGNEHIFEEGVREDGMGVVINLKLCNTWLIFKQNIQPRTRNSFHAIR